ncbi:MAG: type 1 fimbrial protein [Scandinavium sp.]|uniref:type 1 fimbrial protein n=1 Tax=Scandinavium sp. TaxID=2830653 RepID=UPI003F376ACD
MRRVFTLLLLCSSAALADCRRSGGESSITIAPPQQLVIDSHDWLPGEVIWTSGWVSGPDAEIKDCSNGYQVGFLYEPGSAQAGSVPVASAQDGFSTPAFATGLPGVGIAISTRNNAGPYDNVMPIDNRYHPGDGGRNHTAHSPAYNVAIVAQGGRIASGTVTFSSPIARVSFRHSASEETNGDILSRLWLGQTQLTIKALGCELDDSEVVLTLGKVNLSQFSASPTAGQAQQSLRLNCEAGTAVSATLIAAPAAGHNPDNTAVALSYPDDPASATGVGVEIGLAVPQSGFASEALAINQPVQLFTHQQATGEQSAALVLTARYRKTASAVTPGQANATATLNLTYR